MSGLQNARRKLKIAFIALVVVDLAATAVLLSPVAGSQRARREELDSLWKQLQQETRQVEPYRGLGKKIVLAHQEIDTFYKDRLPTRDSAISEALGRLAGQSGVKTEHMEYKYQDTTPVGLTPVQLQAELSGNYLQLVRFINALERDQLFFIVDSVELGGQQSGVVKLQIKLETYLRSGA